MLNASTAWNTVGFWVMNFRYGSVYVSATIGRGTWQFDDRGKDMGDGSRDAMVDDAGSGTGVTAVLAICVLRIESGCIVGRRNFSDGDNGSGSSIETLKPEDVFWTIARATFWLKRRSRKRDKDEV